MVVDSNELAARLLRPRRGNAPHCIHYRAELADAADTSAYSARRSVTADSTGLALPSP